MYNKAPAMMESRQRRGNTTITGKTYCDTQRYAAVAILAHVKQFPCDAYLGCRTSLCRNASLTVPRALPCRHTVNALSLYTDVAAVPPGRIRTASTVHLRPSPLIVLLPPLSVLHENHTHTHTQPIIMPLASPRLFLIPLLLLALLSHPLAAPLSTTATSLSAFRNNDLPHHQTSLIPAAVHDIANDVDGVVQDASDFTGLSRAAVIGIAVGVVVVLILLIICCCCCFCF